jgi:hypothetical protein
MNFINKLQTRVAELEAQVAATNERVTEFKAHLLLDKFSGVDAQGDRKDIIGTADVFRWLESIQTELR